MALFRAVASSASIALLLLASATGCGEDEASSAGERPTAGGTAGSATSAPADACEAIGSSLNPAYELALVDSSDEGSVERCSFASADDGTTLVVEVRGVEDDLLDALDETCTELGLTVEAPDVSDAAEKRCHTDPQGMAGQDQVLAATLLERQAILVATLSSTDPSVVSTSPAELASVEAALAFSA